jgi:hypothetical protein
MVLDFDLPEALQNAGIGVQQNVVFAAVNIHLHQVDNRDAHVIEDLAQYLGANRNAAVVLFRPGGTSVLGVQSCRFGRVDSPVLAGYSFRRIHCPLPRAAGDGAIPDGHSIRQVVCLNQLLEPLTCIRKRLNRDNSGSGGCSRSVEREHPNVSTYIHDDTMRCGDRIMLPGEYHPEDDHINVFPQSYALTAAQSKLEGVFNGSQPEVIQRDCKPLPGFSRASVNLWDTAEIRQPRSSKDS